MLKMWVNKVLDDWRIIELPYHNTVKKIYKREWSYNKWTNYITSTVDKTPLVKDFCFESPIFGQIAPESLSTGAIALIIMANEPDTVIPMCWLGDNCIPVMCEISNEQDVSASFGARFCNLDKANKIKVMETGDIIKGSEFNKYVGLNPKLNALAYEGMRTTDDYNKRKVIVTYG